MSKRKVYRVLRNGGDGWKVQADDAKRASAKAETKKAAVVRAKELAKAAELGQVVVYKMDGTIQTEFTYGNDPYPPKG